LASFFTSSGNRLEHSVGFLIVLFFSTSLRF
jgi:hypothetical protein